jgi:FkbM family methyltransferase
MIRQIIQKIGKALNPKPSTIKIGSPYGGWIIPEKFLNKDSVVYCAGAGEDISFDMGVANTFGCKVYIFDPTPRSEEHFKKAIKSIQTNQFEEIPAELRTYYSIPEKVVNLLDFHLLGLWDKAEVLRFYSPKNKNHVSHSIDNLQETDDYFEAKVQDLRAIMKDLNHQKLDLLKVDIEGAEFEVIDFMIQNAIFPKVFCVEFHEKAGKNISDYSLKLQKSGYKILKTEGMDHTYYRF